MNPSQAPWVQSLLPPKASVSQRERLRAAAGALIGIALTGLASALLVDSANAALWLIAPMGASAVLLFGVPASPLAQPWSIVGGNVISALIGVACAKLIGPPVAAAAAAIFFSIGAMFALRCLHPPSGAVALTAVLGGAEVHAAGFGFVLVPVALNSLLLLATAVIYNSATGRRYPHGQQAEASHSHQTRDGLPTERLGFTPDDLQAALKDYDQVLDISVDDLEALFHRTEMNAFRRRFGDTRCAAIMSKDVRTVEFATELAEAWALMQTHAVQALPVVNRARHVIGIVTRSDFLEHAGLNDQPSIAVRLRAFLQRTAHTHSDKHEVVGQIMSARVSTAFETTPVVELVPLMADIGHHHVPIVDTERRLVGMVTQTDLVAALYEICLAQLDAARSGVSRVSTSVRGN
ncbi:MAG: HPP family protein [Pseudomonadota bacterium]